MAAPDQLGQEFETLADEELIERLRSGDLTQIASDTARRELAKRGVDVDRALVEPPSVPVQIPRVSATTLQRVRRGIGILNLIGVMQQYFTPEPASVMDSLPTR